MPKVTVLITDDSATMRSIIKTVLRQDDDIEIVGEASDPYEAREKIKALNPDVLILDIEMPRMSGLEFLQKIMTLRPMPVVMLSGTTQNGAQDTIDALSIGAFDCLEKPQSGDYFDGLKTLPAIIKAAARYVPPHARPKQQTPQLPCSSAFEPNKSVLGIGSSTGGVEALLQILSAFPKNCPPTIITQHMPPSFLKSFSERLNNSVLPDVRLAQDGDVLSIGQVLFAPGGETHLQIKGRSQLRCHLTSGGTVSGHRPSVDVMFSSLSTSAKSNGVGVILTGLGRDGAKGLLKMRQAGAKTLGQNEKSCVVYGMPKVAKSIGGVQKEYDLSHIGPEIVKMCDRHGQRI